MFNSCWCELEKQGLVLSLFSSFPDFDETELIIIF